MVISSYYFGVLSSYSVRFCLLFVQYVYSLQIHLRSFQLIWSHFHSFSWTSSKNFVRRILRFPLPISIHLSVRHLSTFHPAMSTPSRGLHSCDATLSCTSGLVILSSPSLSELQCWLNVMLRVLFYEAKGPNLDVNTMI